MRKPDNIKDVVARINSVYSTWRRDTSIVEMRKSWDNLYASDEINCSTEEALFSSVPCRWVKPDKVQQSAVIMYIHGGGFRLGSNDSHLKLMNDIALASGINVLGVQYRLMPEFRYPAQLDDVFAVYKCLVETDKYKNIVIIGDSAGGGLAASLLQKLKQPSYEIPQPTACVLLSPWLDMTLSGDSYNTREQSDPVHQTKMLAILAKEYSNERASLDSPLLSPLFGDLSALPPTLIQVGDCEIGLDDSVSYSEAAIKAGSDTKVTVWPNMIHVFQMFSDQLTSADKAIDEIGKFIKTQTIDG